MSRMERTPISKRPRVPPKPKGTERVLEKDPVEVFCRIRPPDTAEEEVCVTKIDSRTVKLAPPENSVNYRNGLGKEQIYRFQHVFDQDVQQKDVFDRVAKPLVSDVLNGKNGLLFAYGVTGSGKTFTMQGTPKDGGIVRRTLDVVFNSICEYQTKKCIFKSDCMNGFDAQTEADAAQDRRRYDSAPKTPGKTPRVIKKDTSSNSSDSSDRIPDTSRVANIDEDNIYGVFVAYIEIYNNYIYDLLEDTTENGMKRAPQTKVLREDTDHNMYVHGCTEVEVKSPDDALDVLHAGQKKRRIAHTRLNCESSRSHSIFTIRVVQGPLDAQGEEVVTDKSSLTISQLSLVDLAGSERTSRTKASGDRLKEAGNINNSLMTLRSCIEVLRDNQLSNLNKKVPYRDSKITHYFKNYFDGEGKVKMVVCVNPKADDYDETMPVMKFAELASEVQIQRAAPASAQRDAGLAPGRRRARQAFKEAITKMESEGHNVKPIEVDIAPIYTLHPDWPNCKVSEEIFNEVVDKLKIYLIKRIQSRDKLHTDVREKVLTVRSQVEQMEKENLLIRQENASLRSLYDDAMRKVRYLENSLVNAEAANESMQRKFVDYNNIINDCNNAKEELDVAKSKGEMEKQRMKAKLKMKLEAERDRLVHDMNSKLKEQENALKKQMYKESVKTLQNIYDVQGRVHLSASDTDLSGPSQPQRTNNENIAPGDVLKTHGGGAQVILQDMEVVNTRDILDPRGQKRPSGGTPARPSGGTPAVDRNTLQERCSEGISSSAPRHGTPLPHIKRARF